MSLSLALSIPIGEWSPFLLPSLSSIASQQDFAIRVAILDASDDVRVSQDIEKSGLRVDYQRKGKDSGQAAAIHEGWENTDSDIVGWLNTDDFLAPDCLSIILKQFALYPEVDVIHGQSIMLINGAFYGLHPTASSMGPIIERSNIISQPSCFAKRSSVNQAGGIDTSLVYTMDWDLWIRLYKNGACFLYLDRVISTVTLSKNTKTAKLNFKRLAEFTQILNRSQNFLTTVKGLLALIRQNLGTYWCQSNFAAMKFDKYASNEIPLVNFLSFEQSSLSFTFNVNPGLSSAFLGPFGDCVVEGNNLGCMLRSPIGVGESVMITLPSTSSFRENLISMAWCGA